MSEGRPQRAFCVGSRLDEATRSKERPWQMSSPLEISWPSSRLRMQRRRRGTSGNRNRRSRHSQLTVASGDVCSMLVAERVSTF